MTFKERITIATHYHYYCLNMAKADPVGGFEDINNLFKDLASDDPRLKEMLDEEFTKIFTDNDD